MSEKVFFAIGVSRPNGMTPLPGVWQGITEMEAWAVSQSYTRREIVTDERAPVTAERLRAALAPLVKLQIERFVVCFIGHGFLDPPDQIWILSAGPSVNTGRVSRNALRASLETYYPQQISMISDACREAQHFPSGVVSILDDNPSGGPTARVYVDNLYSTCPNAPSFAFHAKTGDFCVFTSELVKFLKGDDERAFQLATGLSPDVTTQTLYLNLPGAVYQSAQKYGANQTPIVEMGFPVGLDVYSHFSMAHVLNAFPPKPPDADSAQPVDDSTPPLDARVLRWYRPVPSLAPDRLETLMRTAREHQGLDALAYVPMSVGDPRLVVNESDAALVVEPVSGEVYPASWWVPVTGQDLEQRKPSPLLTLRWGAGSDSAMVMVPRFPGLIATVLLQDEFDDPPHDLARGCAQLSWSPDKEPWFSSHWDAMWNATRFLHALGHGDLVSRDAAAVAVDGLRSGKHGNPMLGVIAAYLYDLVGDRESISRMCHYYYQHGQPIPFDIAMLASGELRRELGVPGWMVTYGPAPKDDRRASSELPSYLWEATPAGEMWVAGPAPLLRSGWQRLVSRRDEVLREFGQLTDRLAFAPIATLRGEPAIARTLGLLRELGLR